MRQLLCPVVVGRRRETALLDDALAAAAGGRGGVVAVTGEAGVGKSRLVREAMARAAERGMEVVAGRAVPRSVPVPLRPLAEAFGPLLAGGRVPDLATLEPYRGVLARLAPVAGGTGAPGGPAEALVLGEAVTRLAGAAGRGRGCLVVLEDLHWSDAETLEVVEYLADHLGDEPALGLATVRTGEEAPAERLVRLLAERRAVTEVALRPLGPEETDRVAAACLGEAEPPAALRQFLRSRSEGVPLLVEELLAGLVEAEALVPGPDGWRVVSRLVPAVPLTFAETVERRLAALGDDSRRVVRAAALLGRRFDWSLLPAMAGLGGDAVLVALRGAVDAQLLAVEPAGDGFRFRHALTRDTVLASLLPPETAALAGAGLAALEEARPGLPGEWCELGAELAERAGDTATAAGLLLESARRSLARGAVATAGTALARARELAPAGSPVALDVGEAEAAAAALAGRVDEAVEQAGRLLAGMGGGAGGGAREARLRLVLVRAAVAGGRWDVAAAQLARAAPLARELGDAGMVAVAGALGAQVAIAAGRLDEAVALAGTAAATGEDAGVPEAACEACEVLGRVARLRDLAEAEDHFERARAIAERHGLSLWRARALHELGTVDLLGTMARDRLLAAREAAVEAGAVATVALVDLHLASVAIAVWDLESAAEPARRCVAVSRRLGLATLGMGLVHVAMAEAQAGREEEMEAALAEAAAVPPGQLDVVAGIPGRGRFLLACRRADFAAALAHAEEAVGLLRAEPSAFYPFWGLWALLRAVAGADGEAAVAEAATVAGAELIFVRTQGELARAVLQGRAGDGGAAARRVAAVRAEVAAHPGLAVWSAIADRLVAGAAGADGWGEPARWLREATAVFADRGLEELASSCRAELRRLGAPVPRRGRGEAEVPAALRAAGVTSREADVLVLLGARLSNREIGARLHLSPRTVERHVANLLAKTGSADRRELADLARTEGLAAGSA